MVTLMGSKQRSRRTPSFVISPTTQALPKYSSDVENGCPVQCCSGTERSTTSGNRSYSRPPKIREDDSCGTMTKIKYEGIKQPMKGSEAKGWLFIGIILFSLAVINLLFRGNATLDKKMFFNLKEMLGRNEGKLDIHSRVHDVEEALPISNSYVGSSNLTTTTAAHDDTTALFEEKNNKTGPEILKLGGGSGEEVVHDKKKHTLLSAPPPSDSSSSDSYSLAGLNVVDATNGTGRGKKTKLLPEIEEVKNDEEELQPQHLEATGHGSEHGILMDYVKDLNEQKSDKLLLSQGKEIQNEKMKPTQLSESDKFKGIDHGGIIRNSDGSCTFSDRVEYFKPPHTADVASRKKWENAMNVSLKEIKTSNWGGEILKKRIHEIVGGLEVLRYELFCSSSRS